MSQNTTTEFAAGFAAGAEAMRRTVRSWLHGQANAEFKMRPDGAAHAAFVEAHNAVLTMECNKNCRYRFPDAVVIGVAMTPADHRALREACPPIAGQSPREMLMEAALKEIAKVSLAAERGQKTSTLGDAILADDLIRIARQALDCAPVDETEAKSP